MSWPPPQTHTTFSPLMAAQLGDWQYHHDEWDLAAPTHRLSGVQKLAFAVLLDAAVTLRNGHPRCANRLERAYREELAITSAWVADEQDHPFSFVWCCQALKIEPSVVRAAIGEGRSLRQRQYSTFGRFVG